jgi:hypothetical protein
LKTRLFHKLIVNLLLCLSVSGCSVPTIVATIASSTQAPVTPAASTPAGDDGTLRADDLTESITTEDGVVTARYPASWSSEAFSARLNLSNAPNLANEIGRRTFLPGELGVIVVYARRADVAANFDFEPDFTLFDLGAATSGGVSNTASESTEINGIDAIAQSGEIGAGGVLTDAFSITYEVDEVFVTLTTYAAPGMKDSIREITELLASNLTVDASKLPEPTTLPSS